MKDNRRLSQGALAESVRRMMDPRAGYRAKNAEHRNQATPAQARAKATASLDGHKDYIRRNMVELGRSVGVPDYTLNNMVGASEFLPGVGDALDVQDAGSMIGDAFKDPTVGKIGGAGIMALAAGLGVLPIGGDIASTVLGKTAKNVAGEAAEKVVKNVAGEAAEKANAVADLRRQANIERFGYDPNEMPTAPTKVGIRAYHGSPHSFDKFDLKHMGTGEGAQAYGKGHYFAGNEDVAKGYRDALTDPDNIPLRIKNAPLDTVWSEELRERFPDMYKGLSEDDGYAMDGILGTLQGTSTVKQAKDVIEHSMMPEWKRLAYRRVLPELRQPDLGKGSMYEVNINADPEDLLDWDKALMDQPEGVQRILRDLGDRHSLMLSDSMRGGSLYDEVGEISPLMTESDRVAAQKLREAGIPGIKYLDGGSRAAGEGSSNYVVFDDNLIDILKKYGLSGVLAGGGAAGLYSLIESRGEGPVDGGT